MDRKNYKKIALLLNIIYKAVLHYYEIEIIQKKSSENEAVNINMNFLGLDLSDVPSQNYTNWKVFVIPVLYVFTSIISTTLEIT